MDGTAPLDALIARMPTTSFRTAIGARECPDDSSFDYVIDGGVRMGLEDKEPEVLEAGDTLHEPPGAVHAISENASVTESASVLALFFVPDGQDATVAA